MDELGNHSEDLLRVTVTEGTKMVGIITESVGPSQSVAVLTAASSVRDGTVIGLPRA